MVEEYNVPVIKRNIRLLSQAMDVYDRHGHNHSAVFQELCYLHDSLYKMMVRLECASHRHPVYDDLYNDILDLTLSIIRAYAAVHHQYKAEMGEFFVASPGEILGFDQNEPKEPVQAPYRH